MPKNINPEKLRRDKAKDIIDLQGILDSKNILKNPGQLSGLSTLCGQPYSRDGINLWKYYTANLDFGEIADEKARKHLRPSDCSSLFLHLSINLEGVCITEDEGLDPFLTLEFEIMITGIDSNNKRYYSCLHLDRHSNGEQTELAHPRYHFQYGGRNVWSMIDTEETNFGASLFIEPPRIAHPPLDIILGIDFVLSNFYGSKRKRLLENPQYINLLEKAQCELWRPYVNALASRWNSLHSNWESKDIWPQLIPRKVL